jgi:hypothetical protein
MWCSNEPREEFIEYEILEYLSTIIPLVYHNDIKGFYDQNKWVYRKNKNPYIRQGISDITGILPDGLFLAIEVKRPSEMSFFDRPMKELEERCARVFVTNRSSSTLKKHEHAILQRQFLDDVIAAWGVAFFASSVEEVEQELKSEWYFHLMM